MYELVYHAMDGPAYGEPVKRMRSLSVALAALCAAPWVWAKPSPDDLNAARWRAAAARAYDAYSARDFETAQRLYQPLAANCPASPDECRKVYELAWLAAAGRADDLARNGDFRGAQRLYERLAESCPAALYACRRSEIYLNIAAAAEGAGDVAAARAARARHRSLTQGAGGPEDIGAVAKAAINLAPPQSRRLDLALAERVLSGAIQRAQAGEEISGADGEAWPLDALYRALMNVHLAAGRRAQALLAMARGVEAAEKLGYGAGIRYGGMPEDLEGWGLYALAEPARREAVDGNRKDLKRAAIPAAVYGLATSIDALAYNLFRQGRHQEAGALFYEAWLLHRQLALPDDGGQVERIDIAAANFGAYRAGWPMARIFYRDALRIHLARVAYLQTAVAGDDPTRRNAVPMLRRSVRNLWNLSHTGR